MGEKKKLANRNSINLHVKRQIFVLLLLVVVDGATPEMFASQFNSGVVGCAGGSSLVLAMPIEGVNHTTSISKRPRFTFVSLCTIDST